MSGRLCCARNLAHSHGETESTDCQSVSTKIHCIGSSIAFLVPNAENHSTSRISSTLRAPTQSWSSLKKERNPKPGARSRTASYQQPVEKPSLYYVCGAFARQYKLYSIYCAAGLWGPLETHCILDVRITNSFIGNRKQSFLPRSAKRIRNTSKPAPSLLPLCGFMRCSWNRRQSSVALQYEALQ